MNTDTGTQNPPSPFHRGEQILQERIGVRESMERFGSRVIRPFMPEQHRAFYQQLPFIFAGHADADGWPWASILFNPPGFIESPTDTLLRINAKAVKGDPLNDTLANWKNEAQKIGLLGIELPSRRRNRLATHLVQNDAKGMTLQVDQSFGNCPQYIQSRKMEFVDTQTNVEEKDIQSLSELDARAIALIEKADTFFVASYMADNSGNASEGADVSHRGGKPGFVRVDSNNSLTIPDYLGNGHFNTLGNILENGKAGLLFLDFESGDLLTLSGRAKLLDESEDTLFFDGAERLWTFDLVKARYIQKALPMRWAFEDYSPNTRLTGTWTEAQAAAQAHAERNQWQSLTVTDIVEESTTIKSFYLKPENGHKAHFKAGQFLSINVDAGETHSIRTYTVSSAPADPYYRISVKREASQNETHEAGLVSNFLHDHIRVGDQIQAKAPSGGFYLDEDSDRPVVLIAAGVGITPMMSMARHTLIENFRARQGRELTLICAARSQQERAFFDELNELSQQSGGAINTYWVLSQLDDDQRPGDGSFHHRGRISRELFQAILPLDDYDFYLCGPSGFMQDMYDVLQTMGVADHRIAAEAFGPASLTRSQSATIDSAPIPAEVAEEALVRFVDPNTQARIEQRWSEDDGSLLDFAESHGLTPAYGCRSGKCGSCKVGVTSGALSHNEHEPSLIGENEALLCCARPAATKDGTLAELEIIVEG